MNIAEIISNALDQAGGKFVRDHLDEDMATLQALNIIDTMMLELVNSSKSLKGYKETIVFPANVQTGTFEKNNLSLGSFFIRYREQSARGWNLLDILDDIEDLTRFENEGRNAVLLTGTNPFGYQLSWTPDVSITAEIWGKSIGADVASLNDLPPFPAEFTMLCAYRLADFVLNQLLIIDPQKWQAYVIAQKQSIGRELQKCEFVWRVYRANPASANSVSRVEPWERSDDDCESGFSGFLYR